jgi:hypothetical protein
MKLELFSRQLKVGALSLNLLLSSCVTDDYLAINGQKQIHHKRNQFGMTASFRRADGSSEANDGQQSARDFFSTVGTVVSAGVYGYVQNGANAADALTKQQAQRQAAALAAQKEKAAAEAAAAAVTPIAPGASVLQGGTLFTAPK